MMTAISNDRELRTAYEILSILADRPADKVKQHADRIKKAIREYRDRPADSGRVVSSDFDSMVVVIQLPKHLQTAEAADAYFMDHYYREAYPSMYDCTGQIFTTWYKIFKRRGLFWAYHSTAMDV